MHAYSLCQYKYCMSDIRRLISGVWFQMSLVRRLISGVWHQMSDVRFCYQTSDNRHLTSDIWNQTSDNRSLKSDVSQQTFEIRHLKSDIWHQTSINQSIKLYLQWYHFIKNALPVSHLHKIFQRNYTNAKKYRYIKKIHPIINYTKLINLKGTLYN